MKRLTLLTILLVVVGLTAGFAIEPTISLSGSGTLEWGVDLETMATGFKNTATASTTLTLAGGALTKAGTEGWYGSIAITAPTWVATDVAAFTFTAPGVTAKIVGMGGAVVIGVVGAPSLAVDFVTAVENDGVDDTIVDIEAELGTDYAGPGTYVSYTMSEALMLGFEIVSNNTWETDDSDAYAMALDVQAKFAPLTINAGVNYGFAPFAGAEALGFGVKVFADTEMVDVTVAFDGQYAAAFAWEVGAYVDFAIMEGVTASFDTFYATGNLDFAFGFAEALAGGLVDKLIASLMVYVLDVTATLEYEVIFTAGYDTGKLYPHFGVTYGNDGAASSLTAFAHVEYDLFEAAPTTLFFEWRNVAFLPAVDLGELVAGVKVAY